jgi:flagellar hook-associated protein 3 FlgL
MSMEISNTRVSSQMLGQLSVSNIDNDMNQLQTLEQQLSSGLSLTTASENPSGASAALGFESLISQQGQATTNIANAQSYMSATDQALTSVQTLVNQAASLASGAIGSDSSAATTANDVSIVNGLIQQLTQIGNTQYNGSYIFGGTATQQTPFTLTNNGVQFNGNNDSLATSTGANAAATYNVTAQQAFGTLSASVTSASALDPTVSAATRLLELNNGQGVKLGSIDISDGTHATTVDLSNCSTLGDVINAINANGVVNVTASLNGAQNGLQLTGTAGTKLSVQEVAGGQTAVSLGLLQATQLPANSPVIGTNLNREITAITPLSALNAGAGIDQAAGFQITVGGQTKTINTAGLTTVGDLINAINGCGLPVQAAISASGQGLTVTNLMANQTMSIGENNGATATDLGIRTMTTGTLLSNLNSGAGVQTAGAGQPDFQISTKSGVTFNVNVTGATTVNDVINDINSAAGNGGQVTASLNSTGNGIALVDTTAGGGTFQVAALNNSTAAADLGIAQPAAGDLITGSDVAPVGEQGIFQSLYALRSALQSGSSAAITAAGAALQTQTGTVSAARGSLGVQMQNMTTAGTQIQDSTTQLQGMLSDVRDLDYASAITKFQTLQTAYQASLQATASLLPETLMSFLSTTAG